MSGAESSEHRFILPQDPRSHGDAIRAHVDALRQEAGRDHRSGSLSALATAERLSREVQQVVRSLFVHAREQVATPPMALIASGGMGRLEMAPRSDVDIVLVAARPDEPAVGTVMEKVLYPLWDARMEVGHAVRTPDDFENLATEEDQVRTTAVDWRPVAGDREVLDELRQRLARALRASATRRFILETLRGWTGQRNPGTVYRLEPDIKTDPGGLRELQRAWWVARLVWRVDSWSELLSRGLVDRHDFESLQQAREMLIGIRIALHVVAGRRQDRLRFEYQEQVAEHLRIGGGAGDRGPADALLGAFYRHAMAGRTAVTHVIERCGQALQEPRRDPVRDVDGFHLFRGHLTFKTPEQPRENPLELVRIFRVAQLRGVPLYVHARELIKELAPKLLDEQTCDSSRAARLFNDILGDSRGGGRTLELLHELGVLTRLLPPFQLVTGLVQRDLYHTYTVDAHLIYCARRIIQVINGTVEDVRDEIASVAQRISRRGVLTLAALLHDIGKGRGGGHAERGARIARQAAERFRLSREDRADVEFLVREHLTMFKISQRRDLEDPDLIARFAATVETPERLDMLLILSYADASTTGPEAWTDWKASLLLELYQRTRRALLDGAAVEGLSTRSQARLQEVERHLADPDRARAMRELAERLPPRHLVTYRKAMLVRHLEAVEIAEKDGAACTVEPDDRRGGWEIVAVGPDRPGLLADLSAVLSSHGVSVDAAQISVTRDALVIDTFSIRRAAVRVLDDPLRRGAFVDRMRMAITSPEGVERRLAERRRASDVLPPGVPRSRTRVVWDPAAAATASVVDLFAPDRVGLLHDVARAIFAAGASIVLARVNTEGERAVDAFYLVDSETRAPLSEAQQESVGRAIVAAVDSR